MCATLTIDGQDQVNIGSVVLSDDRHTGKVALAERGAAWSSDYPSAFTRRRVAVKRDKRPVSLHRRKSSDFHVVVYSKTR